MAFENIQHSQNLRVLRRKEVERKVGLSRAQIYSLMGEGSFPKSIRLSSRSVGWIESDIDRWIKNRMKEAG